MTMNVFLLAPILGCMSKIVRREMSGAILGGTENESESCHVVLSSVLLAGRAENV